MDSDGLGWANLSQSLFPLLGETYVKNSDGLGWKNQSQSLFPILGKAYVKNLSGLGWNILQSYQMILPFL